MVKRFKTLLLAMLSVSAAMIMMPQAFAGDSSKSVTFADGTLSVSAVDVPLGALLDEVAQKAEIEVQVADEVKNARVSSTYSNLSLKEGLIRILEDAGQHAYVLVYRDREQKIVSQLFVLKSERSTSGSTTGSSRPTTNQSPQAPEIPVIRMSPPIMPTVPPPFPQQEGQEPFPPPGQVPPGMETGDVPPPLPLPDPVPPGEMNEVVPPPLP